MKILLALYKKNVHCWLSLILPLPPATSQEDHCPQFLHCCNSSFLDTFPGSFIRFIRLPVSVTRTICRNSFLNQSTAIRPPNLWIATRPGWLSHTSSQGLETDCLSTRFIYNFIRFLDPKYFSFSTTKNTGNRLR